MIQVGGNEIYYPKEIIMPNPEPAMTPALPKVDLHRHLEGSLRLQTVLEVSKAHGLPLPAWEVDSLKPHIWIQEPANDILKVFPRFDLARNIFVDYDVCRRAAWECLEDAAAQGLDTLELRFSPLYMAEPHGLDPMSVASVVCEAWEEAKTRLPIHARLIGILSRTYGPQACEIELNAVLAHRQRGIVGLDLAGDEARQPAPLFEDHFRRAREAGLHVTVHAGEFAGVESVRQAVDLLGAERLGHAVRVVDDPGLMERLAERGIAIECCPTSNVLTCAVPDYASHPLPIFLEHGLIATLNTDDPGLMGDLTLEEEYRHARDEMGLSRAQLDQVQRNGLRAAFQDR